MMACLRALAVRYGVAVDKLLEAWSERAAVRESLAGMGRPAAEVFALGDVERLYQIGLHCPQTIRRWVAGGDRIQPGRTPT